MTYQEARDAAEENQYSIDERGYVLTVSSNEYDFYPFHLIKSENNAYILPPGSTYGFVLNYDNVWVQVV